MKMILIKNIDFEICIDYDGNDLSIELVFDCDNITNDSNYTTLIMILTIFRSSSTTDLESKWCRQYFSLPSSCVRPSLFGWVSSD